PAPRAIVARVRSGSVRPRCRRRRPFSTGGLSRPDRARLIALAGEIMIAVTVRTEMLGCLLALVEQQADPGTWAEHAEAGLYLLLLRTMCLDDKHDLPHKRRECGRVTARHARRSVQDNKTIGKALCHFCRQCKHLIAGNKFGDVRAATPGRK